MFASVLISGVVGAEPATAQEDPGFVAVTPCAVFDTRVDGAPASGGQTLQAQITGSVDQSGTACATAGVVPADASSVMINVVAVQPLVSGNLRISASGTNAEGGVVNFGPGTNGPGTNSNAVPVEVSAQGAVDIAVNAALGVDATHVRLIVLGYEVPGGAAFVPVTPCAVFDSRSGAPIAGQEIVTAQITGSVAQSGQDCAATGVVPEGASAAMINVVAVNPAASGNLRISAAGAAPEGGVVNFGPGSSGPGTNSNAVPVELSLDGAVDVFVNAATGSAATHVRLVVLGFYGPAGAEFVPVTPCAIYDSRVDAPIVGQIAVEAQIAGAVVDQGAADCAGDSPVPVGASAAMINVVAVSPAASGNLQISAAGTQANGGVVNFGPGNAGPGTNSNAVPVRLSETGAVDVFVNAPAGAAATHLRLVVMGWFTALPRNPLGQCNLPGGVVAPTTIPQSECDALVAVFESTNGSITWNQTTGWLTATDPCDWVFVLCRDETVIWLSLGRNGLTGTIPAEIAGLTGLQLLNLGSNDIGGTIPPELGDLVELTELSLNRNQLTGSIPPELGNLVRLEGLLLSNDGLVGTLPPELGNLVALETLTVTGTGVGGAIPDEFAALTNLRTVNLGRNAFTGGIPSWIGDLTELVTLDLSFNDLGGPIPVEIAQLTNLESLRLGRVGLTGSIPSELGSLTNLERLQIGDNDLSGSLPPELANLTSLLTLDVSGNELTGPIPASYAGLDNIDAFILRSNQLSGDITTVVAAIEDTVNFLSLGFNGCFTVTDPAVEAFLDGADALWDNGC